MYMLLTHNMTPVGFTADDREYQQCSNGAYILGNIILYRFSMARLYRKNGIDEQRSYRAPPVCDWRIYATGARRVLRDRNYGKHNVIGTQP